MDETSDISNTCRASGTLPEIHPRKTHIFGPQFSLTASATAVSERPPKQRDIAAVRGADLFCAGNVLQKVPSTFEVPVGGHTQDYYGSHKQYKSIGHSGKTQTMTAISTGDINSPETHDREVCSSHSSRSSSRTQQSPVYIPGDRVIFTESAASPGVPVVYRTPEERSANPDRLNLDRRKLTTCPILEGEDQLRLLNYQHNLITRIQHLSGLKRLIFLDLYDNKIEDISGLSSLKCLRVLMLGNNKISKIENLDNLTKLDVLDLHGNQITRIKKLNHLTELRVLNLAANSIQHVDNLSGMEALTELNLRKNKIRTVVDVETLSSLQRLFLSHNLITCFEDIACLGESHSLSELSLDGNPFSQDPQYKQTVLRYAQQLRQLDMKKISEDERRIASVMARKEEEKKREMNKMNVMKEKRRQAIGNARRQWEVMQGSLMNRTSRLVKQAMPDVVATHVGSIRSSALEEPREPEDAQPYRPSGRQSRCQSANSTQSDKDWGSRADHMSMSCRSQSSASHADKEKSRPIGSATSMRSANLDFLYELEKDTLSLYGSGALDAFDKSWGVQVAGAVTTICFKFIDFNEITTCLHKIRVRFPNVNTLVFNSTNIYSLPQLNALSAVRRLDSVVIENEGNPVTDFTLWRAYLLFRLAHFCLRMINSVEVLPMDTANAETLFGSLSHLSTSHLSQARLLTLLGDKKRQLVSPDDKKSSGESKIVDRTTESLSRAALTYISPETLHHKQQEERNRKQFVDDYVKRLAQEALESEQKQSQLQRVWSPIFVQMIRTAVIDMWDTQGYMKKCMLQLEKS